MKRRLVAVIILWAFLFAWFLRRLKHLSSSSVPSSWGVNIDYTRFSLVQYGKLTNNTDALTLIPSYAGGQNYDFGSYLLASINIITGTNSFPASLEFLNIILIPGLIILPVTIMSWGTDVGKLLGWGKPVLLLLILFPSARIINFTSNGYHPGLLATAVLLFVLYSLRLQVVHWKRVLLFTIFWFILMNSYHTYVFLGGIIVTAAVLFDILAESPESEVPVSSNIIMVMILTFFIVGTFVNQRFYELISNFSALSGGVDFYDVTSSQVVEGTGESISTGWTSANILFTIINYAASVLMVIVFSMDVFQRVWYGNLASVTRSERIVFGATLGTGLLPIIFFLYGGLGTAVYRTQYIGIFLVMVIVALQIRRPGLKRWIIMSGVLILVVTSLVVIGTGGWLQSPHTYQEEEMIQFGGEKIPENEYVFGDAKSAPPLMYYSHNGITIVREGRSKWEKQLRAIYFQNQSVAAKNAIQRRISDSLISESAPSVTSAYIMSRDDVTRKGVPMFSFTTSPAKYAVSDQLYSDRESQKIYHGGNTSIFYTEFKNSGAQS